MTWTLTSKSIQLDYSNIIKPLHECLLHVGSCNWEAKTRMVRVQKWRKCHPSYTWRESCKWHYRFTGLIQVTQQIMFFYPYYRWKFPNYLIMYKSWVVSFHHILDLASKTLPTHRNNQNYIKLMDMIICTKTNKVFFIN